jgi:hypothetical protein
LFGQSLVRRLRKYVEPLRMSRPIQECPVQVDNAGVIDSSGRLVPRSESQRRAHSVALRTALDDIAAIGPDATDSAEIWDEVFRGIDAARPQRPLFGEQN